MYLSNAITPPPSRAGTRVDFNWLFLCIGNLHCALSRTSLYVLRVDVTAHAKIIYYISNRGQKWFRNELTLRHIHIGVWNQRTSNSSIRRVNSMSWTHQMWSIQTYHDELSNHQMRWTCYTHHVSKGVRWATNHKMN